MASPDPLSLDTSSWGTKARDHDGQKEEEAIYDGTSSPTQAQDEHHQGHDNGTNTSISQRTKSIASVMNDDARATRRASRKQRPTRSRSLLDEIAADKAIKSGPTSHSGDKDSPQVAGDGLGASKLPKSGSLRGSRERRRFIQSPVNEADEHDHDDALSHSYASIDSAQSKRVSFEGVESVATPISIPSRSPSNSPSSLTSPRPILGISTKSSAPERRMLRRTSARTSSSSWSPASAFLARWNRDESVPAAEPDDEGQEIAESSGYIIGRQIGYGGFSIVKEAHTIEHGGKIVRAVKIVRKLKSSSTEAVNERAQREFEHEVAVWRCLRHLRILPLLSVYDTTFATFCIMPMSNSGSLFDLVAKYRRQGSRHATGTPARALTSDSISSSQPRRAVPISHAKQYIAQVASAIRYLHQDMRIVHRDIKLENCLLSTNHTTDQQVRRLKRSATSPTPAAEPFPGFADAITGALDESPASDILLCDFGMADFIDEEARNDRASQMSADVGIEDKSPGTVDGPSNPDSDAPPTSASANLGPGPNSAAFTTISSSQDKVESMAPTHETDAPARTNSEKGDATVDPPTEFIRGSLPYAAPELLHTSSPLYSPAADIWAFGVLCYALLAGDLPFRHPLEGRVVQMIEEGAWDVSALKASVRRSVHEADHGGEEQVERAVELVEGCLRMDIRRRWDIRKVLRSDFLVGYEDDSDEND